MTPDQAAAIFEADGLYVARDGSALRTFRTKTPTAAGIAIVEDPVALVPEGDDYLAVFPFKGQSAYELTGHLAELVPVVLDLYRAYCARGVFTAEAFVEAVDRRVASRAALTV